MRFAPFLIAASAVAAGVSAAQTVKPPDISGEWRFKTVLERKGCTIEGEITFTHLAGVAYACSFVSQEDCGDPPATSFQRVEQSCTAMQVGGRVLIKSRVESIIDAGPPEMRDLLMETNSYRADNFTLDKVSSLEMTGEFYSRNIAPVRFWRDIDLIS